MVCNAVLIFDCCTSLQPDACFGRTVSPIECKFVYLCILKSTRLCLKKYFKGLNKEFRKIGSFCVNQPCLLSRSYSLFLSNLYHVNHSQLKTHIARKKSGNCIFVLSYKDEKNRGKNEVCHEMIEKKNATKYLQLIDPCL